MRAKKEISLENYLDFFHSNKQIDLTVNFLNQIIAMHGFKKINQVPKKVLTEAVETLDLVNLSRSTLTDNDVSSCAFINLEDVVADLNDLNWQDCCVTSIQTLNSSKHNISSSIQGTNTTDISFSPNSKSTADCYGPDGVAVVTGSSSYCGSTTGRRAAKSSIKRKRGGGGCSSAGDFESSVSFGSC